MKKAPERGALRKEVRLSYIRLAKTAENAERINCIVW